MPSRYRVVVDAATNRVELVDVLEDIGPDRIRARTLASIDRSVFAHRDTRHADHALGVMLRAASEAVDSPAAMAAVFRFEAEFRVPHYTDRVRIERAQREASA